MTKRGAVRRRIWSALIATIACSIACTSSAAALDVSLGDSYSSGEGAKPYDPVTDKGSGNGCHRSPSAWPRLLGVDADSHLACSGAVTDDFFSPQKEGEKAGPDALSQLTRLGQISQRQPISRVYATIGGNDLGFKGIIERCFARRHCLGDLRKVELARLQGEVGPKVIFALLGARLAAPNADVILVGYPDLIPPAGEELKNCGWIDDVEKPRLRTLEEALDSTLSQAARVAGVRYVSIRDALHHHELCTKQSWVNPVGTLKNGYPEQGHPNGAGQKAIFRAVSQQLRQGAGVVPPPQPGCQPAGSIAAIVDDSGSMERNDPLNVRQAAMQLLITKPAGTGRTLGATEFGTDAGPLFAPATIATSQATMLESLSYLADDGFGGGEADTNYNAAFAESAEAQPGAQARIFLTDGGHNVGDYADVHRGGPRTYVIGLNIGPAGEGDEDADRLRRIAVETGGAYFPLKLDESDDPEVQTTRLQPVFNAIDSLVDCKVAPSQAARLLTKPGKRSKPIAEPFQGSPALEVVASWSDPTVDVDIATAEVTNANGKVIANLTGKARRKHGRARKVDTLQTSLVEGSAFDTLSIEKPAKGTSLEVTVSSAQLSSPTQVVVQVAPSAAAAQTPPVVVPPTPPPAQPTSAILTVDNRVTNGASMREDSTPTRLTTQPRAFCGTRGCNINGTERSTGGTYDAAVCQTTGERITNGNDGDPSDDGNPERFESTRYYGVRLSNGVFGYVSEVWIRASDRGGKGLPQC